MKDINDIMPKIPGLKWGIVTNARIGSAQLEDLIKLMPHDEKWHTLWEGPNEVNMDGKTIRRRSMESMT